MDEIREWNGDLAYCKEIQRNFWVGIYYPNVYDNLEFIHDDQNVITLPRDIICDYIDGGKFVNEIPCDNEGQELKKMNQETGRANDNW